MEGNTIGCGLCGKRIDENKGRGLWIVAPYDCWGVVVCDECAKRYPSGVKELVDEEES